MTNKEIAELIQIAQEASGQPDERLLSVEQVAVQLGVSHQTVRNLETQGKLVPTRTGGGHRRYSQQQVTDLKRKQQEFEIFLRTNPTRLLTGLQQVLTNFRPDEQISITIRYDKLSSRVYFTLDSEDGLQTYTQALKMRPDALM
jgi:excisionase family DNA binding protein